ncbi:MAG: 1-deoxy-D-xylulose-5-phosphate synthase, partial [Actinobacteria bacterium]|nr:1-deoxy-D-xylulose-5-phosphate synthase [Actinomycetota bacterium]
KPLPMSALASKAERYAQMVVIEDGIAHGGVASTLSEELRRRGISTPIHSIGVPLTFIEHSKRNEILDDLGITAQTIARQIVGWYSGSPMQEEMQHRASGNVDRTQNH